MLKNKCTRHEAVHLLGTILIKFMFPVLKERVISPQNAFIMTHLLEGVVQHGTGQRAKVLGRPVAGKTGTSSDYSDAWFVGYTPSILAGAWVGFDVGDSVLVLGFVDELLESFADRSHVDVHNRDLCFWNVFLDEDRFFGGVDAADA
jgi:membrane peptidoglycan carboxypeptidase